VLVWRLSPFRPVGKLLLLLSYYLFWEYFVVSRSYALGVLLGFGFAALQARRPEQRFWPWVLLGLLANTRCLEPSGRSALDCSTRCAIAKSGGSCCPVWRSRPRLRPLPS
jgi:hypothetical protein